MVFSPKSERELSAKSIVSFDFSHTIWNEENDFFLKKLPIVSDVQESHTKYIHNWFFLGHFLSNSHSDMISRWNRSHLKDLRLITFWKMLTERAIRSLISCSKFFSKSSGKLLCRSLFEIRNSAWGFDVDRNCRLDFFGKILSIVLFWQDNINSQISTVISNAIIGLLKISFNRQIIKDLKALSQSIFDSWGVPKLFFNTVFIGRIQKVKNIK